MKEASSNDLAPIIAQAIEEIRAEQGKNFSLEKINLGPFKINACTEKTMGEKILDIIGAVGTAQAAWWII